MGMNEDLTNASLRAIRRILRAADQDVRKLAAATGLTPSQILVLREIERLGQTSPGVIAQRLQFGHATVSAIIERLERQGYITRTRSERDKRQYLLDCTDTGRALLEDAPDLMQTRFRKQYGALPGWEQAMILAGLERLCEFFDAGEYDAAPLIDTGRIDRPMT